MNADLKDTDKVYFLWSPEVKDEGLLLNTNRYFELLDAIDYFLPKYSTSEDLYYFNYYEVIGEGLIFPDAGVLNHYLRQLIYKHGDVELVLTPV